MAAVRPHEQPVPRKATAERCVEPAGTVGAAPWRRQLQRTAGRGADLCTDGAFTFPLGWDLEEERWALKEDQRLCRSRARKYLIETNRRRRAFEERQKQKEEKEQRFREQILQQRKIKFWETTEKFQRVHLPASQRKQIVQTKAAFQLEEALEEIKGSVLTSGLCLPSINKMTFRTTDDNSCSAASRNGYLRQEQISAMVGLDQTVQESSRTSMDGNRLVFQRNVKEMQQLLEKQHLSNLENFHEEVTQTDDSESLSSLDSLEAGEQNGDYTPSSESSLTTSSGRAPVTSGKSQSTRNDMCLNNCQRNSDSRNNLHDSPVARRNALTLAGHTNDTEEEPLVSHRSGKKVAEFSVNKAFPFLQNIKEERNNSSPGAASTLATGRSVFSPSKAWASPDSVPEERVQDVTQNQSFKMTQQKRSKALQTSTEPIAASGISFPNQRCFSGISSPADLMPKDRNVSRDFFKNTLGKVIETKEENIKSIDDTDRGSSLLQEIPNVSAPCNVKKQDNKEEDKANVAETKLLVSDTELGFDTPEQHSSQKNNIYDRKRTKLVRSTLKNEAEAVVMNPGITFGTRPVSSIRDSLELTKSKKKSAENMKYGRKLKWCDQTNQMIAENNESCYEESNSEISAAQLYCVQTVSNAPCVSSGMGAHPSNTTFTENQHENSHTAKPNVNSARSNKECSSLNMLKSTGSSFPKKVWMVPEHEESKSPVSSNDDKIHQENQQKNKAKIIRRPRTIRDQLCSVPRSSRGPGTAVRLQSATEGRAAQGRMLAPQPPSAPALGSKRGKTRASPAVRWPLPSSHPQDTTANGDSLNERKALLADQTLNKNTPGSNESRTCSSEVFTMLSTPRSSMSCEPLAKHSGSVSNGTTSGCQHCSVTCTERCASAKNRLHLDHIPTAEETSAWKGARIALAPEDPAAGVAPVTKQRQILNNCENRHRAFTEQRRQTAASKRWNPIHTQNWLRTVQLRPVQTACEPAQNMNNPYKSEEVSESTAQFLMAEKLTSTAAAEDEILAAMGGVQPGRQPLLHSTAPRLGMSTLSIEEEKIFQSLDHLNQRLQNVQEAITRNPSASGILQLLTPFCKADTAKAIEVYAVNRISQQIQAAKRLQGVAPGND